MSPPGHGKPTRSALKSLTDVLVLLVLLAMALLAAKHTGMVDLERGAYRAADGDSLKSGKVSVRLHGIDAPELAQRCRDGNGRDYPCGREAMAALAHLVGGREVTCTALDEDRYGRAVALCKAGAVDLNAEMVRLGWATAYRWHSLAYVAAEQEAKRARRGLWQGTFESPESWRERHPR